MKRIASLIFCLFVVSTVVGSKRSKRFLGLFNVVQFANEVCNSTTQGEQGTCYTSTECSTKGGTAQGTCAQGFGVCCVFTYSCQRNGESNAQEVIYLQNEDFPQSTSMPTMCIFSLNIKDDTICQLRLDFDEFQLDAGSAIDKPCDRDAMEIFPGGSSDLGNGRLCGLNKGQHLYIPVDGVNTRPMIRLITDGRLFDNGNFTSEGFKFRIKIRQLDCTSRDKSIQKLIAPQGCLQYFTERQGTFSSFNWDPNRKRQYVPDQRYSICFRKMASDCRLELKRSSTAPAFSTSVGRVPLSTGASTYSPTVCGPENGCGVKECAQFSKAASTTTFSDYLLISGAYRKQQANTGNSGEAYVLSSYYCGTGLGRDNQGQTNPPNGLDDGTGVIADGPFIVTFNADKNPGEIQANTNNAIVSEAQNELGFSLDYRVSTSCPDLNFVDSN